MRVLAFDVIETLLDLQALDPTFEAVFGEHKGGCVVCPRLLEDPARHLALERPCGEHRDHLVPILLKCPGVAGVAQRRPDAGYIRHRCIEFRLGNMASVADAPQNGARKKNAPSVNAAVWPHSHPTILQRE